MKEKRSEKHGVAEKSTNKSDKTKTSNTKVQKSTKARKEKKPTDKLADKSGLTIFLQHVFGDAQKKTLRRMSKRVININKLADKYSKMSDEELQKQTAVLQKRIKKLLKEEQAKVALEKVKDEKKSDKSNKARKVKKAKTATNKNLTIYFILLPKLYN
jgi:hypothetical protein